MVKILKKITIVNGTKRLKKITTMKKISVFIICLNKFFN